eukprot:XP_001703951.1 Hypothetical protein GL50803_88436 [Giardia lamblia ATCC 50803]
MQRLSSQRRGILGCTKLAGMLLDCCIWEQTARLGYAQTCHNLVSGQHPELNSCSFQILDRCLHIELELIFDSCYTQDLHPCQQSLFAFHEYGISVCQICRRSSNG